MQFWLVKQEPENYSFKDFLKDGTTIWQGVRNFQARNYLKEMKTGDIVLYYHSGKQKAVVGISTVVNEFFKDPTSEDDRWVAVTLKAKNELSNVVSLNQIKEHKDLQNIALMKQPRLSVIPFSENEFQNILELSV